MTYNEMHLLCRQFFHLVSKNIPLLFEVFLLFYRHVLKLNMILKIMHWNMFPFWVNHYEWIYRTAELGFYLGLSLHSHDKLSAPQCPVLHKNVKSSPSQYQQRIPHHKTPASSFYFPFLAGEGKGLGLWCLLWHPLSLRPGKYIISVTEVRKSDHIVVLSVVERSSNSELCCSIVLPLNKSPSAKQLYLYLPFMPKAFCWDYVDMWEQMLISGHKLLIVVNELGN